MEHNADFLISPAEVETLSSTGMVNTIRRPTEYAVEVEHAQSDQNKHQQTARENEPQDEVVALAEAQRVVNCPGSSHKGVGRRTRGDSHDEGGKDKIAKRVDSTFGYKTKKRLLSVTDAPNLSKVERDP